MRKHNEARNSRKQVAAAAGLAVAAAIGGAVAALLLAPKSGKQTRKALRNRAEDAREKGHEAVTNVKENAKDRIHRAQDQYEEVIEEAERDMDEQTPRRGFWGRR